MIYVFNTMDSYCKDCNYCSKCRDLHFKKTLTQEEQIIYEKRNLLIEQIIRKKKHYKKKYQDNVNKLPIEQLKLIDNKFNCYNELYIILQDESVSFDSFVILHRLIKNKTIL